jgi:putative transcriptional regulator
MDADILRTLERAGYECFVPLERKSCFSIAARSKKQVLLIKVLSNIDSLREEQARDLITLAGSIGASPLLIGERSKVYELENGLVYARYKLPAITPRALEQVLHGKKPNKTFSHGKIIARIDSTIFKQKLDNNSISAIAQRIHVTREAIYNYKKTLRMDYGKAVELEHMFHADIIKSIDLFSTPSMPEMGLHGYLHRMGELGFNIIPVHKGFDALAEEKEALLVDEARPSIARRKAGFMRKASEFFDSEPVFVTPGKTVKTVKGVPVITEKELKEAENAGNIIDLVKKRRKEKS